jgi:hypothetical protein
VAEPTHPAIVDRQTWDAAQATGAERGNVRDAEMPTSQPGRRYILRSRIRDNQCQRRMHGIYRPAPSKDNPGTVYTYYKCPHDSANPRHAAAHPGHGPVSVREDALMNAIGGFFAERVFGPGRAAMLAAQLPASAADHADQQARQSGHLRRELARIDTAEHGLITELEAPADPADPTAQAYRARIRARYAELYDQRTGTEAQLADLEAATPQGNDPALLDELPMAASFLPDPPDHIKEALLTAFDIQCLYRKDKNQVTIWATLTDTTPQTITAILTDPRTQPSTPPPPATPFQT